MNWMPIAQAAGDIAQGVSSFYANKAWQKKFDEEAKDQANLMRSIGDSAGIRKSAMLAAMQYDPHSLAGGLAGASLHNLFNSENYNDKIDLTPYAINLAGNIGLSAISRIGVPSEDTDKNDTKPDNFTPNQKTSANEVPSLINKMKQQQETQDLIDKFKKLEKERVKSLLGPSWEEQTGLNYDKTLGAFGDKIKSDNFTPNQKADAKLVSKMQSPEDYLINKIQRQRALGPSWGESVDYSALFGRKGLKLIAK